MNISKVILEINKKYGDNTIGYVSGMKTLDIERTSSGSTLLDWALGGGWPLGRFCELYGHFSSGKSLICLKTIAAAQKRGMSCVYIDAENGFDPVFATSVGVDVNKLLLSQLSQGESAIDLVNNLLEAKIDLIVVDSVAALVPKVEMEEEMEHLNIAPAARLMSKGLRKMNALNMNTLVLFINQIRMSPGSYGNPEVTTGGKALGHYASIRLEVRRGDFLKDKEQPIGQVVKFKVTKNKTAPPYRQGYFNFYYTGGIDLAEELVTLGLQENKITKRGAWLDIGGESFQGRPALEEKLAKDDVFYEKVKEEIYGKSK